MPDALCSSPSLVISNNLAVVHSLVICYVSLTLRLLHKCPSSLVDTPGWFNLENTWRGMYIHQIFLIDLPKVLQSDLFGGYVFALGYPPMTWRGLGIHQTLLIDLSGEESPSTGPQELLYTPPPTMPSPCPITPHAPPCHFLQPPCPLPSATSYGMEIQVHMGGAHEAYNALCIEPYIASCLGNTKGKNYVACGTSTAPWFWAETM